MYLLRLAIKSLGNRRFSALLTVIAIGLSVTLLLAVEKVRTEARSSFASTISGTDLIVGARSGSVRLASSGGLGHSPFVGRLSPRFQSDGHQPELF